MSRILSYLLQTEFLGRLSRKIVYIIERLSDRTLRYATNLRERLPYVVLKANRRILVKRMRIVSAYYSNLRAAIQRMPFQPKISVLIPVYKTNHDYLKETLMSVEKQIYTNWEVCIVDDCSNDSGLTAIIENFFKKHPGKVKFFANQSNLHISLTSNECLKLATGEYVALLDHDDRLYPSSLAEMIRSINLNNEPEILYSDERTITGDGHLLNAVYHKPGWSPFMHLSMNYTTHLSVYRTSLLRKIEGFRKGFEGAQDHDLMLRAVENSTKPVVHVPLCLYQWRAHPSSTAHSIDSKPYAAQAGEKAVTEAIARKGRSGHAEYEPHTMHYRLRFNLPQPNPLVSIVIPSKNSFSYISKCLQSIFEKSTYSNFEVIISDNGTDQSECLDLYQNYSKKYPSRFKAIVRPAPFNFGKQINIGVQESTGEYLIILNNDAEVITADWIQELLSLAQFPEIGAVGCKLLFPEDGTVQHAGIMTVGQEIAGHIGLNQKPEDNMYSNILNTIHESIAVTAACFMIRKAKFLEIGGHDEVMLANGYGDLELCFRLRDAGYTSIFTPYALLYHHESPSREVTVENFERFYLMQKYPSELLLDPYLNPNLTLIQGRFKGLYYNQLTEINGAELKFFLDTPIDEWKSKIDEMR